MLKKVITLITAPTSETLHVPGLALDTFHTVFLNPRPPSYLARGGIREAV